MATTNIELDIENITGVADADDQFIISAQKLIVASVPSNLLSFAITKSTAITDENGYAISTNVVSVERDGFPALEAPFSLSKLIDSSTSLHKATNNRPKWFISDGTIFIKPDPVASTGVGYVYYIDYSKLDDDCSLRSIVIHYACASEFTKLSTDLITSWTSLTLPVPPSSPSFGNDLAISSSAPTIPVLISNIIDENDLTVPTFISPVISVPDWTGIDALITTEEDSGMVEARMKVVNGKIGEYNAKLKESQSQFQKENVEYQGKLQIAIENAKLESSDDNQLIQKYTGELNAYQQNIAKEVQDYVNTLNKNIQEYQNEVARYSAELQSYQLGIGEQTAEKSVIRQNIEYYAKQATIHYEIAEAEITRYIQKNQRKN